MSKNQWRKPALICLLAFLIPFAVMLMAYASLGMAPWGDKTILASDMANQYAEFFCALKGGDLFFSWSKALGTSYIGVFSYYVSSPLSALTLLAPNEYLPVALMFLAALKVGLAGAAFALYAQRRFPGSALAALLCAVSYALMTYNIAYSLCIMWLDGVIWLPLVILALERILDGRGFGPLVAVLAVCFFSCWYISYMIGIFCLLYFIARAVMLRLRGGTLAVTAGKFLGGAACAMGLTAWLWLPTFLAMFNGKFSGGNWDYNGFFAGDPLEILIHLVNGSYTSLTHTALPYVACGVVATVLAVLYFYQRYPLREKLAWGGLLLALVLSMMLSSLDKAWHLFMRPNWFPWRYGFLIPFVVLTLAMQALPPLLAEAERRGPALGKAAGVVLLALALLDLNGTTRGILRGVDGQFHYQSNAAYRADYAANADLTAAAFADGGDAFFRIGATEDRGHNGPLVFGYPGLTHYSSFYSADVIELTKKLGFSNYRAWCAYYGSTPVTDALLDFHYVISRGGSPYEAVASSGDFTLYKNPAALPLAFVSAGEDVPTLSSAAATPFERQNDLLKSLSGTAADAFTPVGADRWATGDGSEYHFTGTGRPVYADLSGGGLSQAWLDGGETVALGSSEAASVHYLGTPAAGETGVVTLRHDDTWAAPEPLLWELDRDVLSDAVQAVNRADVQSVADSGTVRLTVAVDGDRTLLTTIPAEPGWTAYVDGRKTEHGAWLDTFLTVPLTAGEHTVTLRYTTPGLFPGVALGVLSAAALVVLELRKRRR